MDIEHVGLRDAAQRATQLVADGVRLSKQDVARQILPADTTFAVVINGRQRNLDESFVEADVSLIGVGVSNTDGYRGQFVGYLALTPPACRIYVGSELVSEAPIANVAIDYALGVLTVGDKKYQIAHANPISGGDNPFESHTLGLYNGLAPAYRLLEQGGATGNKQAAKRSASLFMIIFVVLLVAMIIVILKG